jgi:hypothetical protein
MRGSLRTAFAVALAALLALGGGVASAAAKKPPRRIEVKVRSLSADAKQVKESYVSLYAPLPASAGPRPKACDRIGYLRFRDAHGPRKARKADAVFVTMPGIFAGAGSLDIFARNMVRTARAHHRHVEVWTLDRRSNCLEDHYGIDQGKKRRNYRLALNYYYHGAAINGRRFGGFKSEQDAQFLKAVGLEQTVRDEYYVINRGMPHWLRKKKVFCGGHSLGGPLTTAFAGWDFDGNPKSKRDAGYNQCAGFFALDTRLNGGTSGGGSGSGGGDSSFGFADFFAAASNGSPYVNAPPFTPETIQAVPVTALAAFVAPHAQSAVNQMLPDDSNFNVTFRTLFSRNAQNAITQMPSIRDFRVTNEAALGGVFDDNSSPVTILRTSLGTFRGGPVAQKEFPAPYNGTTAGGLIDGKHLMIPIAPHGPLYGWVSYDRMRHAPVQKDDSGHPFTNASSEVTAMHQFARSIFEAPADFAEQYFPLRLLTEDEDAGNGDRSGSLENYRYNGIPKRPQFYADAQHGIEEGSDPPPLKHRGNMWVRLHGYNHIDVATAALRQNNGKHEAETAGLWKFARALIGPRRKHR